MDRQQLERAMQIRYVKLHFGLSFQENTRLPMNKASAIRGGIGEMLLRANCIRDRDCAHCDFEEECIVRRTMYSRFQEKPAFVTSGDSVGYVLECENYKEDFREGEILEFQLILFGRTMVYFHQFLQAVWQLGRAGLGKGHSRYEIAFLRNTRGKDMLDGQAVRMERYEVRTIEDYVNYRLSRQSAWENRIRFQTPVTLKHQGRFQEELTMEAVILALFRRLYLLDCFEGLGCDQLRWQEACPKVLESGFRRISVYRYSGRQDQKMALRGVKGEMLLSDLPQELLAALLAGEVMHIGKNTSFGFGRYSVH